MMRPTVKRRIFQSNLLVIVLLVALTAVLFNIAVRLYIRYDIVAQLQKVASSAVEAALRHPGVPLSELPNLPKLRNTRDEEIVAPRLNDPQRADGLVSSALYVLMLNRSLKEPLSLLNADFLLLDQNKQAIDLIPASSERPYGVAERVVEELNKRSHPEKDHVITFRAAGTDYAAVVQPVSNRNSFGLGWVVIYANLRQVKQLQGAINLILLVVLVVSALLAATFSSRAARQIAAPFSALNAHVRAVAERKFAGKIGLPTEDEWREFVSNINVMTEKLERYDNAQKTFLQNVSHELRTPLMSIQGYAEGIRYQVVDPAAAADVILKETERLTGLVGDLLYLSRLEAVEENEPYSRFDLNEWMADCVRRMNGIALPKGVDIEFVPASGPIELLADREKLSRALANLIGNSIRYAESSVVITARLVNGEKVELRITDDGPGFEVEELPFIFDRFFKGKKGEFGLGLAISKSIIEKHAGGIRARNAATGAEFVIELPTAPGSGGPEEADGDGREP